MKTLILFDVDGTLLKAGTVAMECLGRAFTRVTERPFPTTVKPAGKTDPLIVREALRAASVPKRDWVEMETRILRKYPGYLEKAEDELRAASSLLEGVEPLLDHLYKRGIPLGLLTGNLENTARRKLDIFKLNRYFPVGGFGSDCADRNRLARIALERACRYYSRRFEPSHVWVIGDTPRDVQAARAVGARALAVATGPYPKPILEEFLPDAAFDHLGDVGPVVKVLNRL